MLNVVMLHFLFLIFFTVYCDKDICPYPFEYIPQLDTCLHSSFYPLPWYASYSTCKNLSSDLLTIRSMEEYDILKTYVQSNHKKFLSWLGVSWNRTNNFYQNPNGDRLKFSKFLDDEPSNHEDCVAWTVSAIGEHENGWLTIDCYYSQFFTCRLTI